MNTNNSDEIGHLLKNSDDFKNLPEIMKDVVEKWHNKKARLFSHSDDKKMNRTQALKKDKAFYAEEEDDDWYVFGDNSGFAYGQFATKQKAEQEAERMNQQRKK